MNTIKATASKSDIELLKDSGVLEVNGVEYIRKDFVVQILEKWQEKLNGEIRESGNKLCPECGDPYITYTCDEYYQCNSCDHTWT